MSAIEQQDSHRPPSDGGMAKEEFIRVGTTLYKIVEQPKLNGGYIRKRIAWNNETLRQDYGKDYIGRMVTNSPRNKNFQWFGTGNGLCKRKTPEKRMSDYAFREKKSERLSY